MEDRPKLLDLFCCAGGASMGYYRAGFDVVGVDIKPQPHYPFPFILGDALDILHRMILGEKFLASDGRWYGLVDFVAIHASPPCQRYSEQTRKKYRSNHPDLIEPVRDLLEQSGKMYVIENVEGAKKLLKTPSMLCGTMFGLKIWRHRYFEISPSVMLLTPFCQHDFYPVLITGTTRRKSGRFEYSAEQCRDASGLFWMTRKGMDEAIPPAYTEFIGKQLIAMITRRNDGTIPPQ